MNDQVLDLALVTNYSQSTFMLVIRARFNTWSSMLLPLPLDDDNQIYIRTLESQNITEYYRILQNTTEYYRILQSTTEYYGILQNTTVKLDRIEYYNKVRQNRIL